MAILEVRNIHKTFGHHEVLKGISFDLEKGQILSIIGSSGNGKTTLLRCLNFLETPEEGNIVVNGANVFTAGKNYTEKELRQNHLHFGMVFQNFNLFPQYTVKKNLLLAAELLKKEELGVKRLSAEEENKLEEKAINLLNAVNLPEKANAYPCELSGGQQQRVAIARALMLSPDILCFDEPTSALDPELTAEVLKVIRSLKNSDRTMIIVTHEMEFAKSISDKIMFMSDGYIEELGTPEEIFEHPKSKKTKQFLQTEYLVK